MLGLNSTFDSPHTEDRVREIAHGIERYPPGDITDAAIGLKLKRGSEIQDREQNWVVPYFLPCDTLILVAGQVGLGKTTACLSWAASITNGQTPILGGARDPQNVLMLSNEDSETHIRRIFSRLGGDLTRLYVEDEDSDLPWSLENVPALEAQIEELKPALVITTRSRRTNLTNAI